MATIDVQELLLTGISAVAETQIARYQANAPQGNSRGAGVVSGPEGQPASVDAVPGALTISTSVLLIAAIGLVVVFLVARS